VNRGKLFEHLSRDPERVRGDGTTQLLLPNY
jgi:hypothetical protein